MKRRFSLDSTDYHVGAFENGGLLGKGKGPRNRRSSETVKNSSLVEAQMQFLEQSNLNQRLLTSRQQTIEEDLVDGIITRNSFRNHNKTFHKIFPDIPEEDNLTHTFTCALQKEVLYHGKLYVSHQYICFYSSVLLKATKVIIEVGDIHVVKKKNTAKLLPNALSIITTNGDKYIFVSLRNRDACYQLLFTVCPHIKVDSGMNPQVSQSSVDLELDILSGNSSQDESVSRRTSVDPPPPLGSTYADITKTSLESPRTSSSQRSSISKDDYSTEDGDAGTNDSAARGSWMLFGWEKVRSFLYVRESQNINAFILIYVLLLVLLLLSSGYIVLRIAALEEQLSTLDYSQEDIVLMNSSDWTWIALCHLSLFITGTALQSYVSENPTMIQGNIVMMHTHEGLGVTCSSTGEQHSFLPSQVTQY